MNDPCQCDAALSPFPCDGYADGADGLCLVCRTLGCRPTDSGFSYDNVYVYRKEYR
jgi:hypothetical protein